MKYTTKPHNIFHHTLTMFSASLGKLIVQIYCNLQQENSSSSSSQHCPLKQHKTEEMINISINMHLKSSHIEKHL